MSQLKSLLKYRAVNASA